MSAPGAPLRHYLAEWYRSAASEEQIECSLSRLHESVSAACAAGSPVQLVMAIAVPDDEMVFCVFAARSQRTVARVCQQARLPAQRLSRAVPVSAECGRPTTS